MNTPKEEIIYINKLKKPTLLDTRNTFLCSIPDNDIFIYAAVCVSQLTRVSDDGLAMVGST